MNVWLKKLISYKNISPVYTHEKTLGAQYPKRYKPLAFSLWASIHFYV
jgi:hypothetical protein